MIPWPPVTRSGAAGARSGDDHGSRQAATGWFVRLLVAVLLTLTSWVARPVAAQAETTYPVEVSIEHVTPVSGASKGEVTITGTAVNTSSRSLRGVQVYLWRSSDPIDGIETLRELMVSDPSYPHGSRLYLDEKNYFNITTFRGSPSEVAPDKQTFEPGERVRFTVSGTVDGANGLGFKAPRGSYVMGVQVKQDGDSRVVGRARTFWTVAPDRSVPVTQIVHLASRPSLVHDEVLSDDHLVDELRGRLVPLLQLARTPGTSVLVDPMLVDELTVLADGHRLHRTKNTITTGQDEARAALETIQQLVSQGRVHRTPYGSADLFAARVAQRPDVLRTSTAALPKGHLLANSPLAIWPRDGLVDQAFLDFVAAAKPSLVLAGNLSGSASVQRSGQIAVVRVDQDAFNGALSPDPRQTPDQMTARLQAQEVATAASGRTMVTVASSAAQAQAQLVPAAWRIPTTLSSLVAGAAQAPKVNLQPVDVANVAAGWVPTLDRIAHDVRVWGDFTGSNEVAAARASQVTSAALSTQWTDEKQQAGWARAVTEFHGGSLRDNGVSLKVTPNIVTSAENQEIPVTVANNLPHAVQVKVVFTSENPQRLDVDDSELVTISPGDTETLKVRVRAHANGSVEVGSQLVTRNGDPVGQPSHTTVTATEMGRIGWLIIVGSGVVLLAATGLRIRQVQREHRRNEVMDPGSDDASVPVAPALPPVKAPVADLAPTQHEGDQDSE